MIKNKLLQHRFVETMPDTIEPGILYISTEYATAAHQCCCGCGEEVVTPFSPAQWQMTFNGETISVNPSIGNWNLRCRSHYFVREGRVIEAPRWTNAQIEAGRKRDKGARTKYFDDKRNAPAPAIAPTTAAVADRVWPRFKQWLRSTFV
jgi:hypothetical protein